MDAHARPAFHVRRVAIIGAGPCGLAAAKYLLGQGIYEQIDIYEQQDEVGGVWDYSVQSSATTRVPQTSPFCPPDPPLREGHESPLFPTPMYNRLHTNIPRALMQFSDLPFQEDALIFPSRQHVQDYLVQYARPIRHLIKFSTQVADVRLRREDGRDRWDLDAASTTDPDQHIATTYDAVIVASGHYATTFIPDIPGIANFHKAYPGTITHSKSYRSPEAFTGKKVVVVGNSASGLDIGCQIGRVSQAPLLLSVRTPTPPEQLAHVGALEVPEIEEFLVQDKSVRFKDGRVEDNVDAVVFATGYLFTYPFLPSLQPSLITDGRRVHGLYKHMLYIDHPTLVFFGLPIKVIPFPLSESQAAMVARIWANQLPLPSTDAMKQWEDEEAARQGAKFHVFPKGGDAKYINSAFDWIASLGPDAPGKIPPHWDAELMWQRQIYAAAKLKFEAEGQKAKTLEELGFVYTPLEKDVEEPDSLRISLDIVR